MIRRLSLGLAMSALIAVPTAASAMQGPEYETTRIADGVYMFRYRAHNAMFVATGEGVIAFDPISTEAAQIYREEIRKVTREPIRAIVYSHHHGDHITGAAELATGVRIIAHTAAYPWLAGSPNPAIPLPDITFTDQMSLRLGGKTVDLIYLGPSHTDNMIVAHLPDQGIIFAVDFVSDDAVGFRNLPGYHFPDIWESLERLQHIDYQTAIFGHGPPGTKADVYEQMRYWADLRRAVQAAIQDGLSEDAAVDAIELAEYRAWRGYENWFKDNVRTVYRYYAGLAEE